MTHSIETDRQQRACKCEVNSQALLQTGVNRLGRKSGVMANWYLPPERRRQIVSEAEAADPPPWCEKNLVEARRANQRGWNKFYESPRAPRKKEINATILEYRGFLVQSGVAR